MAFHDHMQRNRFELKYVIDERTARGVRDFIRTYLVRDRFARPELAWSYPIYSVYLDGAALELFYATMHGHADRFKLRARYYDEGPESPVFLEVKRHANDVILKKRAAVRRASVDRLLSAMALPRRADLLDEGDPEAWMALQRFCDLRASIGAEARTIVAYMREAWNAKDNDGVRVTFDRRVVGSWYDAFAPDADALRADRRWVYPALTGWVSKGDGWFGLAGQARTKVADEQDREPVRGEAVVLELKFTGCYPRWMEELATTFNLYRTSMAKYVRCAYALGPRRKGIGMERLSLGQRGESLV